MANVELNPVIAAEKANNRVRKAVIADIWMWRALAIFQAVYALNMSVLVTVGIYDMLWNVFYSVVLGVDVSAVSFSGIGMGCFTLIGGLLVALLYWNFARQSKQYLKVYVENPAPLQHRYRGGFGPIALRIILNWPAVITYCIAVGKVKETTALLEEVLNPYAELVAEQKARREAQRKEDLVQPIDPDCVLEVRHLRKTFPIQKTLFGKVTRELVAVDDVSFKLKAGETLGIVGESGCGKTTAGRAILRLHEPTAGQIIFDGQDITHLKRSKMREIRKQMQIIFQDPYSSLPPRDTVGGLLSEPVLVHKIVPKKQVKNYVLDLMDKCGLRDYYFERYPHEFSGGQRQRICIARALSVKPKLVICDEPVSALDVSIQAQIINLLKDLQREMNLAYVFISHDLSVVKFISDKIGVMYLGGMMEFGSKEDIFTNPLHPYTKALFSAVPNPDPTQKMQRIALGGDIPSPANPPKGCRFHTRCPYATEKCKHVVPEYKEYEPGHFAACHLLEPEEVVEVASEEVTVSEQ